MAKQIKMVQGAYISLKAKLALEREAIRQDIRPATFASQILEKEAKKILLQERKATWKKEVANH